MRRLIASAVAVRLLAIGTAPAMANEGADNNCAGAFTSLLARILPPPTLGQLVAAAAHDQAVDNFNLANCGNTSRKNP